MSNADTEKKRTWKDWLLKRGDKAKATTSVASNARSNLVAGQKPVLRSLEDVRTTDIRKGGVSTNAFSMLSMYLGGISGGFNFGDIPDMKRDPDVSVGLEYLLTPILNAKVVVVGQGEEQVKAQEVIDRFWQHDLGCFKDMFCYGYCPAEVRYKQAEEVAVAPPKTQNATTAPGQDDGNDGEEQEGDTGTSDRNMSMVTTTRSNKPSPSSVSAVSQPERAKLDYDGMIPLEPNQCVPYVHEGKLAYIQAYGNIKLEGNTDRRPAKGFWLANDPTYSPFTGNSVLPGAWLFWRAKIGMPDSAVEVLLKANYKAAFSGLQIRYPSEEIVDDDGQTYDARAEAEWYAENVKAGTNVVLPSETDDQGKPKWDITSYGGQPIDIQKMLPLMDWLTKQIHRGIGVVDDVITKEGNVGSYSRANVSRQMFLMLALQRARRIAHTFDQMVCRPLMKRNGYQAAYKIEVSIPGMEDDQPNGDGIGGKGNGIGDGQGFGNGKDGQSGGEGEEGGPLAKLFQQAMGEGDEEAGANEASNEGDGNSNSQNRFGKKDMSFSQFLGDWRSGIADSGIAESNASHAKE